MPQQVRVRFAPSPTGFLHIGGLRTALYDYLFAKKNKGVFILRIEDTDQTRNVPGGIENIIKTLQWCGLNYDEGPYIQSERLEIYKKYAEELVEKNQAYYCACTPERLETLRQEQMARKEPTMYDGHCREVKSQKSPHQNKFGTGQAKVKSGSFVIRLKVPKEGTTKFTDMVRGEISFENKFLDDQVLIKSDGFPTYHLANVIDDHLMKITHVIRGEEWLPSTPKHILLYQAFGWIPPQFAHPPLLLNSDHSKLSKRQGDVAVEDYIKKGYLPETLLNFVAFLGWNPKTEQEFFSLKNLIKDFRIEDINKAGAVVNFEKMDWLNGHYLKQKSIDELVKLCAPYLEEAGLIVKIRNSKFEIRNKFKFQIAKTGEAVDLDWLKQVVALEQERLKKLSDIIYLTEFFFTDLPLYEPTILRWKKMSKEDIARHLRLLADFWKNLKNDKKTWNKENLEKITKKFINDNGLGVGETLWPARVALSGRQASPPPFEIAEILGREKTLKRLLFGIKQVEKIKNGGGVHPLGCKSYRLKPELHNSP